MKTSVKTFIAFGFVLALIIGFLIGISVEYPKIPKSSASGTIGKIENYRNKQSSTTQIQFKNELVSDTAKLKSLQQYLNFYYLTAVKMSGDISTALSEANSNVGFKKSNEIQISNLSKYDRFLSSARTDLLLAISVCVTPEKTDPLLLKDLLNQASNVVAQMNFQNRSVLEFVDLLATYIKVNKSENIQGLMRVHDVLTVNEINFALMARDKMLLKSFDKKQLLSNDKNVIMLDQQKLNKSIEQDVEKLGRVLDSEKLGRELDSEKLGLVNDAEKLSNFFLCDAEKLSLYGDVEKLGLFFDAEKLGNIMMDSEKLQFLDSEALGILR
jgi:hypothetical protein